MTALVLYTVTGCAASTPDRVVRDFVAARIAGDDARAALLTVEGDLGSFGGGEPFLGDLEVSCQVQDTNMDGDHAVVTVRFEWRDGVVDIPYVCRRGESEWKVSLTDTEKLWLGEGP
jgi:hypothetical protein